VPTAKPPRAHLTATGTAVALTPRHDDRPLLVGLGQRGVLRVSKRCRDLLRADGLAVDGEADQGALHPSSG
jgi:hypothetical protein